MKKGALSIIILSFFSCNIGYNISEIAPKKLNYACECKAADGTIIKSENYKDLTLKQAQANCSKAQNKYDKNKMNITCIVKTN